VIKTIRVPHVIIISTHIFSIALAVGSVDSGSLTQYCRPPTIEISINSSAFPKFKVSMQNLQKRSVTHCHLNEFSTNIYMSYSAGDIFSCSAKKLSDLKFQCRILKAINENEKRNFLGCFKAYVKNCRTSRPTAIRS
jgi:hypothetical protein